MKLFTFARAALITFALALLALPAASQSTSMEPNSNRRGNDYSNFPLAAANPELCRQACDRDNRCAAYTYVGGQAPHCWLKNVAPPASPDNCCVSGIKGSGVGLTAGMEMDMNRRGGDYANFNLSVADPNQCKAACTGDQRCRAYTYVKPGVQGPGARCWLKGTATQAFADACCISGTTNNPGIVAGGGGGGGGGPPIVQGGILTWQAIAGGNIQVRWPGLMGQVNNNDVLVVVEPGFPEDTHAPNWSYFSDSGAQSMRPGLISGREYELRAYKNAGGYRTLAKQRFIMP